MHLSPNLQNKYVYVTKAAKTLLLGQKKQILFQIRTTAKVESVEEKSLEARIMFKGGSQVLKAVLPGFVTDNRGTSIRDEPESHRKAQISK